MIFKDIIAKKRDGGALSVEEIERFVAGLADQSLPAEQVSALAMAILLRGMDFNETAALTQAMARSGTVVSFAGEPFSAALVDKHSTGGVGDKVSFLLAPIAAACGCFVPMVSGRGLGHTGGTLDKLDAIPGYRSTPDLALFQRTVRSIGCAIVGQTADIAPADRRFYAIRDVTGTVESIPLITASILSKKLASGTRALVMDVKVGSGAFMPTMEQALALARSIIGTSATIGLATHALITDMSEPLGWTAGNAVEIREAVRYLTSQERERRLDEVTLALAAEMLILTGIDTDHDEARRRADHAVRSGRAAEKFSQMVAALGGPADFIERHESYLPAAPVVMPVLAEQAGYLQSVDTRAIGNAIIRLGGGRTRVDDRIDLSVGFTQIAAVGSAVGPDQPLMQVHAATREQAEQAAREVQAACTIGPDRPSPPPVVRARLTGD
jgi:thymidine phosphorylase